MLLLEVDLPWKQLLCGQQIENIEWANSLMMLGCMVFTGVVGVIEDATAP
jgi:hypothetical protein